MPRSHQRPPRGQHFLRDVRTLERIAYSLPITPGARVIEIGAGEGALTEQLLKRGARVTALEIDPALARHLQSRFGGLAALEILEADVLGVDLRELLRARSTEPVLMAGNLPYYITSPILRKVFAAADYISQAVFLMQKEVARRVVAGKGSRDYGLLSVLCRLHAESEYLFSVPPTAFRPPPKVSSAAVRLAMHSAKEVPTGFVRFLQRCFRHPRKTLLNNLTGLYDRAALAALPEARQRAQQLDLDQLKALWDRLSECQSSNPSQA